ncbi:MAG TPA: hypothetical protein VI844_02055 [Coxiellaceae bacterium]|nr:hypothetical protein [Coxiellaceae bacterium]
MKKVKLSIAIASIALLSVISHQAGAMTVTITASSTVSNIPSDFSKHEFTLMRPWDIGQEPGFIIDAAPSTSTLDIDPRNNMPTLRITDESPDQKGLTWFYYCQGLRLNYANPDNTADIVFSGTIDDHRPGGDVQCTCSGSACSTTQTVPTSLLIQ